jgi:hypothetical protein
MQEKSFSAQLVLVEPPLDEMKKVGFSTFHPRDEHLKINYEIYMQAQHNTDMQDHVSVMSIA